MQVIAEKLGRSIDTVRVTATKLGLRNLNARVPWSKREDALLRKLYLHKSHQEIAGQIGRSTWTIGYRAHELGIRRKAAPPWSKEELTLLKKLYLTYETKEIAARIGRSAEAVAMKRSRLGLKKRKRKA